MPKCPVCEKDVSILQWDIFGRGCAACVNIDPREFDGLLEDPCPECDSVDLFATSSPGLAYKQTRQGIVATKVANGLFIIGCADCGHAFFKFNREGAAALRKAPGWMSANLMRKIDNQKMNCPSCDELLYLKPPSGVRISDADPSRIFCEACDAQIMIDEFF